MQIDQLNPYAGQGAFLSDKKEELLYVLEVFNDYASTHYEAVFIKMRERLSSKYPEFESTDTLVLPQIFIWLRHCARIGRGGKTMYQHFLDKHLPKMNLRLSPFTVFMLNEWQYTFPGFFYPSIQLGAAERVFQVDDILDGHLKTVAVYSKIFTPPETNAIMTGLLLPDLLQFFPEDSKKAASALISFAHKDPVLYFDQLVITDYPEFLRILIRHSRTSTPK
ncbi:hypothetical protein CR205_06415 [Alteribacter lacisalsi]|uniref:Uncharacterized protein n=1 Tax=Alteribacter lacisalsi TaxID=2045244 RepID=A0A2W0HL18_9BACI|nr:hypothetical protein [Alteribacter lacisalsi]PYZ98225.1 hypothetical protein CR205_06415 [Alteribacter lacisalsi]